MIVRLYETPGCGLCAEAFDALARLGRGRAFSTERVDVSADPLLLARYALRVPVLAAHGNELDAAGLSDGAIARWLGEVMRSAP
ncbi:MAG: glutaredoxin family protein [Candidatus Limnocylindria bacterium]|nr:glutaredoxin family protein [Candidatus Limnocylindria bacterium]